MAQEEIADAVAMYCGTGGSDKIYLARVRKDGAGYSVDAQWGARLGGRQQGQKTKAPVALAAAVKMLEKLVSEKLAKNYQVTARGQDAQRAWGLDGSVPTLAQPETSTVTADSPETAKDLSETLPQLLNPIDEDLLETYLKDDRYLLQPKHDGVRAMVHKGLDADSPLVATNRRGTARLLPPGVAEAMGKVAPGTSLDGELVGELFHVFDVTRYAGKNIRPLPYRERLAFLTEVEAAQAASSPLQVVETVAGERPKRKALDRLLKDNAEGVVFKDETAPYVPGRPNSMGPHLKYKFYATLSAEVASVQEKKRADKRSIPLQLYDDAGNAVLVGNVTVPEKHGPLPKPGAIVEVRYLYLSVKSLYQPTFLCSRDDMTKDDCLLSQAKPKQQSAEIEVERE